MAFDRNQGHPTHGLDPQFVDLARLHGLVDRFALGNPEAGFPGGARIGGEFPESLPDRLLESRRLLAGVSVGDPAGGVDGDPLLLEDVLLDARLLEPPMPSRVL